MRILVYKGIQIEYINIQSIKTSVWQMVNTRHKLIIILPMGT